MLKCIIYMLLWLLQYKIWNVFYAYVLQYQQNSFFFLIEVHRLRYLNTPFLSWTLIFYFRGTCFKFTYSSCQFLLIRSLANLIASVIWIILLICTNFDGNRMVEISRAFGSRTISVQWNPPLKKIWMYVYKEKI